MALSGGSRYPLLARSEQRVVSVKTIGQLFFQGQTFRIFEAPTLHIKASHLVTKGTHLDIEPHVACLLVC